MPYENIRLDHDAVAVLTIDRPKALNALNSATLKELEDALRAVAADRKARALIVTGAGEKAFVAGADIAEMADLSTYAARELSELGHNVCHALEALPIPTLAAVNGFALGGGCELALSCDLIYAAERAKFGQPEVNLAVIPGFGGTQRLTRLVGRQRARELIFTGQIISAAQAKEIGLVLDVLPNDRLIEHCRGVATQMASKGPLAIANAKRVIAQGADVDLRAGNELERQAFAALFSTADQKEGMKAFLEKRPAVFQGK